jgi:phage protein D
MPGMQGNALFTEHRPVVKVDGETEPLLSAGLIRLDIVHPLGAPAILELQADLGRHEGDQVVHDLPADIRLHASVRVIVGDDVLFSGRLGAVERQWAAGSPSVILVAHDALHHAMRGQHLKRYMDMSAGDVVREIAHRAGLAVGLNASGMNLRRSWTQFRQTDLQLLKYIAAHCGADFRVEDGTLYFEDALSAPAAKESLRLGDSLKEASVRTDLSGAVTTVQASGWDHGVGGALSQRLSYPQAELHRCPGGAAELTHAGLSVLHYVPVAASSAVHANSLARSVYTRRGFQFVQARGLAERSTWLKPGRWLRLEGLGPDVDASFHVRVVQHHFTSHHGMQTRFLGERPCAGSEEVRRDASEHRRDPGGRTPTPVEPVRRPGPIDTLRSFLRLVRR